MDNNKTTTTSNSTTDTISHRSSKEDLQKRKGSLLVYDDQPLWVLPDELANKMNIQSPKLAPHKLFEQFAPSQFYSPPEWVTQASVESQVPPPVVKDKLDLNDFPHGQISTAWINMMKQGLSEWIKVPVIVARGPKPDANGLSNGRTSPFKTNDEGETVVGITAAMHGNEVNGVSCIQRLMADLDVSMLKGTVVAVPCLNVPGYLNFRREFSDGRDLNRLFPGSPDGTSSQIYAYLILEKIVNNFNYLIDLHTASFGRVNSYYVRADMNDEDAAAFARLQQPQIILHNSGQDGTLRSAACQKGIKSITVEIGNPQQFQNQFIQWSYQGLLNILEHLQMYSLPEPTPEEKQKALANGTFTSDSLTQIIHEQPILPVICSTGFWTYTRTGGVLEVYPLVNSFVKKGMVVARIKNIFGNIVDEYFAPCDAMVIGRSSNPVAMAGDRIIHFGVPQRKGEALPAEAKENY